MIAFLEYFFEEVRHTANYINHDCFTLLHLIIAARSAASRLVFAVEDILDGYI